MKTLLMWGLGSDLSNRVAHELAGEGNRLLLVGENESALEQLDAALSQSELHRLTKTDATRLEDWVREQNVGLDGVVLFPPAPEPTTSLFVPASINLRSTERSLLAVVELIRGLLPQLRRGKRPKRILVVLDWHGCCQSGPLAALLERSWEALMPSMTYELNKEGSHFNVLCLQESTEPLEPAATTATKDGAPLPELASDFEPESSSGDAGTHAPSAYVQSVLSLIGMYFSPTMQFLNGQFLYHPSHAMRVRAVSTAQH